MPFNKEKFVLISRTLKRLKSLPTSAAWWIYKTGGTDEDIAARRKKAQHAFAMLTPVWRSKDLRTATKIRIFNTNVKAVILYGSEKWRVTTASTKQVQTFIKKWLRRILRVYWPDLIWNKDFWKRTGQERIIATIKRRRWKWIGHTLRKDERNIARHVMDWNPQGTWKRGRPRTTWRRSIQKDLKKINMTWCETKRAAQDRQKWKASVDTLCPHGTKRTRLWWCQDQVLLSSINFLSGFFVRLFRG